jgi:predicted nucleic acid-binding protein
MTFFVDTNIPLGYTIIHDKFHDHSKNFIEDNEDIFWSNLVKKEYTEKLDALIDDIEIFLKIAENELKENIKDFPSYYTFEKYVLKRTKRFSDA